MCCLKGECKRSHMGNAHLSINITKPNGNGEANSDEDNLKKIDENARLSEDQELRWPSDVTATRMSHSALAVLFIVSPKDGLKDSSRGGMKDSPRDGLKDCPRDGLKDSSRDGLKDSPRDDLKDSSRDDLKDSPRDGLKDCPRDGLKDSPRDGLKDSPRDDLKDSSRDGLKDCPRDGLKDCPRDGLRKNLKEKLKAKPLNHVSNLGAFLPRKDKAPHMVSPVETRLTPSVVRSKTVGGEHGIAHRTNWQNIPNEGADVFSLISKPLSNEHQRYRINIAGDPVESDRNSFCSWINPNKCYGGNQDNWRETLYALIRFYGFKSRREGKAIAGVAAQRLSAQLKKPTQNRVQMVSHGQRVLSQMAFHSPRKAPDEKFWHVIPMPWQQSFVTMMQNG
eukprot:g35547.t1